MTPETIGLVRASFANVIPVADEAAAVFYERLSALDPSLRRLFADDLGPQKRALMATLRLAVEALDCPAELMPIVEELGVRHAGYGVRPDDYATAGSALLWTLEQALGPAFTPAVRSAWAEAYALLAATMLAAARAGQRPRRPVSAPRG
jgi:hemoglobin-like flavoprotein